MNAQELTKYVAKLENRLIEVEKTVKYLEQLTEKQQLRIEDLEIEIRQR